MFIQLNSFIFTFCFYLSLEVSLTNLLTFTHLYFLYKYLLFLHLIHTKVSFRYSLRFYNLTK
nr:MAG TPA: hypothetical protein [Caudoviricetes sp.]